MSELNLDDLEPRVRDHYRGILGRKGHRSHRLAVVGVVGIVLAAILIPIAALAGTTTILVNGGNTVHIGCHGAGTNISYNGSGTTDLNVYCVPKSTTTTTVPPTTTTTTQPSGSCPGGKTTGEDFSHGGTLGPFSDSSLYGSNGYTTYVENDGAYQDSSDTMSLCVQNAGSWSDTIDYGPAGNGAVQGYPDTNQSFNTDPTSLTSTFNATSPPDANGNWESAYDLWGSWGDSDIMVWENTSTARGAESSYGGAEVQNTNAMIDGVSYTVIYYCGSTPNCTASSDTEHMLVRNSSVSSGTENLQDDVNYLASIGDIPANPSIGQADFGWEVCSTGTNSVESPQTFTLNSYTLTGS